MILVFTVYGDAQSKGSTRAFVPKGWTRPIITDSNRNLKQWQQLVAEGADRALAATPDAELLTGAVRLTIAFYLPRPKSLPKKALAHVKKPDLDKLIRGVKDALTKVVWMDDSQVVELVATKQYALEMPHVDIRVEPTAGCQPVVVPPAPLPLLEAVR
jgi:Holliday junction resolvase RusA-like endonuclease